MNIKNILHITFLIFYIFCEINCDENSNNSSAIVKKRTKRYLRFQKGSRFFFRINVKDNMFRVNQIFAHAYGFRANYDILEPQRSHKIFRREIIDDLETMINQHGLDGRSCILKTFCEASKEVTPESGMLFKLFKMIFTNRTAYETDGSTITNNSLPEDDAKNYPYLTSTNCDELNKHCPLTMLGLSPYTDV